MLHINSQNISPYKDQHKQYSNLNSKDLQNQRKSLNLLKKSIKSIKNIHKPPNIIVKGISLCCTLQLPKLQYHRQLFYNSRSSSKIHINSIKQQQLKRQNKLISDKILSQNKRPIKHLNNSISLTKNKRNRQKMERQKQIEKQNLNLCQRINKKYSEYRPSKIVNIKSKTKQQSIDSIENSKIKSMHRGEINYTFIRPITSMKQ